MTGERRARGAWTALACAGAALAAVALACLAVLVMMQGKAAAPEPSPAAADAPAAESRWPAVDWAYWQGINPDVVGWISIPGTNISQPVVQARRESPDFYLSHDVYRNWNPWGAVYIDADCAGGLLGSPNAVVYGHHMDDGSMFAALAGYSDPAWAAEHATVLVQTPTDRRAYQVRYADIVNNRALPKRIEFLDKTDFDAWYSEGLESAAAVVNSEESPEQTISLVTCSYWRFSDERTVVVCSEDFADLDTVVSDGTKAYGVQGRRAAVHELVWGAIEDAKEAAETADAEAGAHAAHAAGTGGKAAD